jgi:hypothetical protein
MSPFGVASPWDKITDTTGCTSAYRALWRHGTELPRQPRTIADCFRLARQAGAEAGMEAFRDALAKGLVDTEELARIEKALHCRRLRALLTCHA